MLDFFSKIDFLEIASAFIVLFAVIDPLGNLPIIINLREKGEKIYPWKVTVVALAIMIGFLFAGEFILRFLGVDIHSFAAAGAIILFLMALEMVSDIVIFHYDGPEGSASIVPLAFPLFAGPSVFTALIAFSTEYASINIVIAILLNMILVYIELRSTNLIVKILGEGGIYVVRKFFGIVLLAISVKLFTTNISTLIHSFSTIAQ